MLAECFIRNRFDDLFHKRVNEQLTRFLFVDASLLHVEEGGLVELSGGGAMGSFDIIGIDLQLGLGTHLSGVGEQEVAVGLMRFDLLCVGCYLEVTDEATTTVIVQNELDELRRGATAYRVRYVRLSDYVFFSVQVL